MSYLDNFHRVSLAAFEVGAKRTFEGFLWGAFNTNSRWMDESSMFVLHISYSSSSSLDNRTMFGISANAHLENMNAVEQVVLDGTSKWSCKIAITGK